MDVPRSFSAATQVCFIAKASISDNAVLYQGVCESTIDLYRQRRRLLYVRSCDRGG
jgi:hypothetical protein